MVVVALSFCLGRARRDLEAANRLYTSFTRVVASTWSGHGGTYGNLGLQVLGFVTSCSAHTIEHSSKNSLSL